MKKILLSLLSLSILFTACNNDDLESSQQESADEKPLYLYGVKHSTYDAETKGVSQQGKLWEQGAKIKIKFLDGSPQMQNEVVTIASEWLNYAGVEFDYVADGMADVRISFDQNVDRNMNWSYTGTDCKNVSDQNEATMNFAYWDELSADRKKGDVLRAFGGMLGLEFEHRHLKIDPSWSNRIKSYWTLQLGDIPWETLRQYVFDKLDAANVIQTRDYDPQSIMIWPFTIRGLVRYNNGYAVPKKFNTQLSENDKAFIAQLYPQNNNGNDNKFGDPIVLTIKPIESFVLRQYIYEFKWNELIASNNPVKVDFGSGKIYEGASSGLPTITYEIGKTYTVKIWAKDLDIKIKGRIGAIWLSPLPIFLPVETIHLSKDIQYTGLDLSSTMISKISFTTPPDFSRITSFANTFQHCRFLKSIPNGLFDKATRATNFYQTFFNCESLTSIPATLFEKNIKATDFSQAFMLCYSLTNIPASLFDKNTEVKKFFCTFSSCNTLKNYIPLWKTHPHADGTGCYEGCDYIKESIPSGWK